MRILALMRSELVHKGHQISYIQYGNGPKVMLAFHGFGQDAAAFKPLATELADQYTIYSFDIFYHGRSYLARNGEILTKKEWMDIIIYFLDELNTSKCSLLAFSLGGKFALATVEKLGTRIEEIMLLAPDGIQTQLWYNLATYPLFLQRYFQSMIVKPHRFFNILSFVKRFGIVDRGILKFAATQMNTVKKRRRVYYSWVAFKKFTYNLPHIAKIINNNQIRLTIFTGKHDKIITAEGMKELTSRVPEAKMIVLNSGHNDLIEHTAEFIRQNS